MLAVASTPAFRSMTVPTVPPDYCCDQFYYEVTVRYADGSMRHYRTAEGLDWPAPLQALLRAIG